MITLQGLLVLLIIGAIAGWIVGYITQRRGFGIVGNIVVGVVGAAIGNTVLGLLGFAHRGVIAQILVAVLGAMLLLWVINAVFKKK